MESNLFDILCENLSKEDQEKIRNDIEERLKLFKINESRTLNDVEFKDLVWPSIKRISVSDGMFK